MDWKTLVGFTIIFHVVVYSYTKSWVLRMDTKRLNRWINGLQQHRARKYFRIWFRLGSYVSILIGFPVTFWLFGRTIFYALLPSMTTVAEAVTSSTLLSTTEPVLELHNDHHSAFPDADIPISAPASTSYLAIQPILPGWNLPLSYLPYYLLAILISVVVHELGHAIASASHNIPILSVGVSLFGPLIPAAHVELNSAQLGDAQFKKQLDILTAGVWMNMYLSAVTFFFVPLLIPALLYSTHTWGTGIAVTTVMSGSGAEGPAGLQPGDIIFGVENCPVQNMDSWLTCLEEVWGADPVGVCLDTETIAMFSNTSDNPGCCGPAGDTSATHLCFMQKESRDAVDALQHLPASNPNGSLADEKPPDQSVNELNNSTPAQSSFCLPAKQIMSLNETTSPKCYSPSFSCKRPVYSESQHDEPEHKHIPHDDHNDHSCYLARILKQYRGFRIIRIHRKQGDRKGSILFVGNVWDLRNGVHATDYVPRNWWLTRLFSYANMAVVPGELETVLMLTAGLSAGLAVVNMLPIYGLDGYLIVDTILQAMLGKRWEAKKISRLVTYISWGGALVAALTIICSVFQSF